MQFMSYVVAAAQSPLNGICGKGGQSAHIYIYMTFWESVCVYNVGYMEWNNLRASSLCAVEVGRWWNDICLCVCRAFL